jgi:hypothetical protein
MTETKQEARARWRLEGREREVQAFRDKLESELRASGLTLVQASKRAFRKALTAFPAPEGEPARAPASPPRPRGRPRVRPSQRAPLPVPDPTEAWDNWEEAITEHGFPDTWGSLPDSAALDVEVEWVHQNRVLVVEDRPGKPSLFHWERAQKPPPSYGAVNLMEFAANNRKGFMDILQRVKPGMDGEENMVRREKVKVEEIRRVLEQMREVKEGRPVAETEV